MSRRFTFIFLALISLVGLALAILMYRQQPDVSHTPAVAQIGPGTSHPTDTPREIAPTAATEPTEPVVTVVPTQEPTLEPIPTEIPTEVPTQVPTAEPPLPPTPEGLLIDLPVVDHDNGDLLLTQERVAVIVAFSSQEQVRIDTDDAGHALATLSTVPPVNGFGWITAIPLGSAGYLPSAVPFHIIDHQIQLLRPNSADWVPMETNQLKLSRGSDGPGTTHVIELGCDEACAVMVVKASGLIAPEVVDAVTCDPTEDFVTGSYWYWASYRDANGWSIQLTTNGPDIDKGRGWTCQAGTQAIFVTDFGSMVWPDTTRPIATTIQSPTIEPSSNNDEEGEQPQDEPGQEPQYEGPEYQEEPDWEEEPADVPDDDSWEEPAPDNPSEDMPDQGCGSCDAPEQDVPDPEIPPDIAPEEPIG